MTNLPKQITKVFLQCKRCKKYYTKNEINIIERYNDVMPCGHKIYHLKRVYVDYLLKSERL